MFLMEIGCNILLSGANLMLLIEIQCRLRKYLANRYVDDIISKKVFRQVEKGCKIGDL